MGREDGFGVVGPDKQRDDRALQVLQEAEARGRRILGAALGEGQLRVVGVLTRGSTLGAALGHLDVGRRAGGRRILNDLLVEAVGHVLFEWWDWPEES